MQQQQYEEIANPQFATKPRPDTTVGLIVRLAQRPGEWGINNVVVFQNVLGGPTFDILLKNTDEASGGWMIFLTSFRKVIGNAEASPLDMVGKWVEITTTRETRKFRDAEREVRNRTITAIYPTEAAARVAWDARFTTNLGNGSPAANGSLPVDPPPAQPGVDYRPIWTALQGNEAVFRQTVINAGGDPEAALRQVRGN